MDNKNSQQDKIEDSKLLEHYKKLKAGFNLGVVKLKESNFMKSVNSNVNHLSDITKSYTAKGYNKLNNFVFKNSLDLLILRFIEHTNNKKDLTFKNIFKNKADNDITTLNFRNRRLLVISFTLGSLIFHSIRNKQLYLRVVIPYFILYSLLFARENLNPYNNFN